MPRQKKGTKNQATPLTRWLFVPWYPIAMGAFAVVALMAANAGQLPAASGSRALLLSIALAGVVFFLCWLGFAKQAHRAAMLSFFWLVLFFTYGHAHNLLRAQFPDADFDPWQAAAWAALLILAVALVRRPRLRFESAAAVLNVLALGLLTVGAWQIVSAAVGGNPHTLGAAKAPVEDLARPNDAPDVYFFLLDSYGRQDVLMDAYKFDNSPFINALEERGFFVAQCSQSNYVRTDISLGSSLNMTYLQDLDESFKPDSSARGRLWNAIKHSAVRYAFESLGYKIVTFATGFQWLDQRDADLFLQPPPLPFGLNEFEVLFMRTTLARYALDWGWVDGDALLGQKYRNLFNNIFDHIGEIAGMPEATFTYAHVISPHPPFVFYADGSPAYPPDFWNENRRYPPDLYSQGYQNQLVHLNDKMLEAVDTILAVSSPPPIIIIQGDHGPWLQPKSRRMWILNAYFLPGDSGGLYPTISPVNSFRLVFDAYFGGHFGLLPDVSYFSPALNMYDFAEVPNFCVG